MGNESFEHQLKLDGTSYNRDSGIVEITGGSDLGLLEPSVHTADIIGKITLLDARVVPKDNSGWNKE